MEFKIEFFLLRIVIDMFEDNIIGAVRGVSEKSFKKIIGPFRGKELSQGFFSKYLSELRHNINKSSIKFVHKRSQAQNLGVGVYAL